MPTLAAHLRRPLAVVAASVLLSPMFGGLIAAPAYATGNADFVSLANVKRASVGLGPVSTPASVGTIAAERGVQMASANVLAHDLSYVTSRLGQLGVCWSGVGEIIAWQSGGPQSYQFTIDQWWASAGHHAIIIGDYDVAGGSWSTSSTGAIYSVMVFVKTCGGAAPAALSVPVNVPPAIASHAPASGAVGVSLTPTVTVAFSESVIGISTSTFVLRVAASGSIVAASVSYDAAAHRATLRPASRLALGQSYRVTLSGSIHDAGGASLACTSWTFRTTAWLSFIPARTLGIGAGTHTGYRFSSTGAIIGHRTYWLSRTSSAPTSRSAVIPTHAGTWYYVTAGVWAGYWLPASSSVKLA